MAFYWVNIGGTYKEVSENKFLWAPSHTENRMGTKIVNAGWKHVPKINKGDIIFCNKDGEIIYVAIAKSDACPAPIPSGRAYDEWKKDGYKIDVELEELATKFDTASIKDEFLNLFNDRCSPKLLTVNSTFSELYMISIPNSAGAYILNALGDITLNVYDTVQQTLDENQSSTTRGREIIVNARVGQGKYRSDVLKLWNNTCPVTNVDMPDLLIASHIVPWVLSNNDEKIDKYNGLPLTPSIDKLFDRGYVSFSDSGELLSSTKIQSDTLSKLGIDPGTTISGLTDSHKYYLQQHREIFEFSES